MKDVHMNIEAILTERVGKPAKKIYTTRSCNGLIVTGHRLVSRFY